MRLAHIRSIIGRKLAQRLENQSRARLIQNPKLWQALSTYIEASRSTGCGYGDYDVLYAYIRTHKPTEVLECGTGVSTIVIAHALMENEHETGVRGRVTSMEEHKDYYEHAQRLLPKDLAAYVDLVQSPTIEDQHMFFRGIRYRDVPLRQYDFVFVDGPDPTSKDDGMTTCDFDFLAFARKSEHVISALIDNRTSTCYVLNAIFGSSKFRFDYIRKLGFVHDVTKHDVGDARIIVARVMKQHTFRRPDNWGVQVARDLLV